MSRSPYQLPGWTQLASFEAAARHLSFKAAAQELNVTSSAISHQIRALEDDLATQLFERRHRQIALTQSGELLYTRLRIAFSEIAETTENIRAKGAEQTASIAATTAVSSLWLTPRITKFLKDCPNFRVEQILNDEPSRNLGRAQLQIVYGEADLVEEGMVELFRDELVPVCSPDFAKRYGALSLAGLARVPLISLQTDESQWMSWASWFKELGYLGEVHYSQKVNNYLIALQAARDDAGVVLGWKNLVEPMINRNELVVLTSYALPANSSFYLRTKPEDDLNQAALALRDWLVNPVQQNMNFF